jgi:peptidoglycan/xylan/chitin deacetylase (PgdA/CDA1 family)
MVRVTFLLKGAAGKVAIGSIDDLEWGYQHIPAVMFWFSDGLLRAYTEALPMLASHNIRGNIMPITDLVGTANHCTWAQLHTLENAGWIVGNGTKDHTNLNTLTEAQQEAEWTDAIAALVANGFSKGNYYAETPGGYSALNADSFTAFANVGLKTVMDSSAFNNWRPMFMPAPPPQAGGSVLETDIYRRR